MKAQTTQTISNVGKSPRAMPEYAAMSEPQLISHCQQKDQVAFQCLLKRYERNVLGLLYRLAPELQDTSDLVQEVHIRLWTSLSKLRNPYAFRAWVNQITTNVFYDELRRRRHPTVSLDSPRYRDDDSEGPLLQIADTAALPDELAERSELRMVMQQALAHMPQRARMMIVLRDLEGLSYQEIAESTHAALGTVKSRIARARARLQVILLPYMSCEEIVAMRTTAYSESNSFMDSERINTATVAIPGAATQKLSLLMRSPLRLNRSSVSGKGAGAKRNSDRIGTLERQDRAALLELQDASQQCAGICSLKFHINRPNVNCAVS